jgi:WD40 repeat protein/cytochrome c551/c552
MPRRLVILLCLPVLGRAEEKISYDDHVFPIFQQACLNCHNPDKSKGGLDLSSFAAALKGGSGGKIAEPGDAGSPLISAVEQTSEKKMPPEGDKLSAAQIRTLKLWIEGGLLETQSSAARKPSKPKFETTPRSSPAAKPDGPPPMPEHLLLEPPVVTARPAAIHAIATSPWAPLIAVTGQHQILLHHTESLELVGILPFPEGEPISLAFTPDGRYLIVGGGAPGKSGMTVTFDIVTGSRLLNVAKEFDTVLAADIRPEFDLVATGGPSRLLKLWNTETGQLVKSIKKHTDWITALDLSGDGVLLASGDRNGGVWVWESQSASEFHTLRGHQAAITATVFRSDSDILATASEDGTVRYWEMNGGSEVRKNDAHPGGVTAIAFARDGSSVTCGRDLNVKLWKPDFSAARELVKNLPALPTAVALDSEGKRAFVADAQGCIRVFDTADGKALGEILANPPSIEIRLKNLTEQASADPGKSGQFKDAIKRWSAAAINSKSIATRHQAEEFAVTLDASQLNFTRSADTTALQATALNQKRNEREQLAKQLQTSGLAPEIAAEIEATLTALDIRIARQQATFKQAENETLSQRDSVDQLATLVHGLNAESISLRKSYLEQLK